MSRVLKFRGWDKSDNSGFYNHISLEEMIRCDFEIMQFIGLLDKNGEEVYEGDIIKYKNGDEYSIGEVRYLRSRYVLITSLGYHGFTTSDIEILGNIHQHSELLKDKS